MTVLQRIDLPASAYAFYTDAQRRLAGSGMVKSFA